MSDEIIAAGYLRLSGEDERIPGTTREKFLRLRRMTLELAAKHAIPLTDEQIIEEPGRASGQSISKRPAVMRLLDMCSSGAITHLITVYQDRLTRGSLEDEAVIYRALTNGGIVLITSDAPPMDFGRLHSSDELTFGIRRALGRWYARDVSEKRRAANADKYSQNRRVAGAPPYGYIRSGNSYTPSLHYPIIEEVFKRARRHESVNSIVTDLNRRGIASPHGRIWSVQTLRAILGNTVYAGYHSRVYTRNRDGSRGRRVAYDKRVIAGEEGDWPHPITIDVWHEIQSRIASRRIDRCAPRTALLTGILFCIEQKPMSRVGPVYRCTCEDRAHSIRTDLVEHHVRKAVKAIIAQLPSGAIRKKGKEIDRAELRRRHREEIRRASNLQTEMEALIRQAATLGSRFDPKDYEAVILKVSAERDAARATCLQIEALLAEPDPGSVQPLIEQVREIGIDRFWTETPTSQQIRAIRALISRIDTRMSPTDREVRISLRDWLSSYRIKLPPSRYIGAKELARRLGVHYATVQRMVKAGRLLPDAPGSWFWFYDV